jgi:hypothetical protein
VAEATDKARSSLVRLNDMMRNVDVSFAKIKGAYVGGLGQVLNPQLPEGVTEMPRLGVVSSEHSRWGAQCVPIYKCDGTDRIVTAYMQLNGDMDNLCYPAMTENDLFHVLCGSSRFTKFDLTKFYWQITLSPVLARVHGFLRSGHGEFRLQCASYGY